MLSLTFSRDQETGGHVGDLEIVKASDSCLNLWEGSARQDTGFFWHKWWSWNFKKCIVSPPLVHYHKMPSNSLSATSYYDIQFLLPEKTLPTHWHSYFTLQYSHAFRSTLKEKKPTYGACSVQESASSVVTTAEVDPHEVTPKHTFLRKTIVLISS